VDRLTDFLQRFELRAMLLHNGALVRPLQAETSEGTGRLYLLRRGTVELAGPGRRACVLREPSLIFYARPQRHVLRSAGEGRPELLGAAIEFGAGDENPLLQGLDLPLCLPLASMPGVTALIDLLFVEAASRRCGQAAVLERLSEVLVVRLLRLAMERKLMDRGVMAGLSDPRLARAAEYLKRWRVGLAKRLLREGRPVKQVALEVGYGSSASFGRAFGQVEGATPTAWLQGARESAGA
jgi:AraC-like DNA-binding protein